MKDSQNGTISKDIVVRIVSWVGVLLVSIGLGYIHVSLGLIFLGLYLMALTIAYFYKKVEQDKKEEKTDGKID